MHEATASNQSPLISIITPSFNQAQFLPATIDSVRNQTYRSFEHLIVDGGSTDGTLDVLRKEGGLPNLWWVSEPDAGQADAIRKGFRMAKGRIVTWLNSDDVYLSPRVLERVVDLFQAYPDIHMVTGGGAEIDAGGHWVQMLPPNPLRINARHLRFYDTVLQPATFLRREVMEEVSLDITLHYAFDWEFFARVAQQYNLLVVPDVWAGYRMWGQNKTAAGDTKRVREIAEVTRRLLPGLSWQYVVLRGYSLAFGLSDRAPARVRAWSQSALRLSSNLLWRMTFRRIQPL